MSLVQNDIYRFGDFELQPASRAFLRRGEKVPLAPKTFDVLTCLVANAGRLVLKDELLKAVWPGAFVEESNLTQHIFWLRKALADKASYIVTIPGSGYQFTAPVHRLSDQLPPPPTPFTPNGAPLHLQQVTERTHVVFEETTTTAPPLPLPARLRSRLPLAPRLTIALSASLLLLLALAAWGLWRLNHRVVPGDHHEVVLADFQNSTGDPSFDRALKTLLSIDLSQSPSLLVASDPATRKVLKLMDRSPDSDLTPTLAREVCERLNDQVVLAGLIARFGQKYLVTLTASDCSTGQDLVQTKSVAASRDAVIQAVDSVAADMRKRLGEPLPSLQPSGQRLVLTHTFSLEALRFYSQARALHVRLKFSDAVPLYKHALQIDPNFVDAWAQLANCYNNLGEALLGRDAMSRAYDLRDRAEEPERLRITSMYEYWKTGDRHAAIRTYQAWANEYPLQTNPWVLLGEFQASVGRVDLAIPALQRAVAVNPDSVSAASDLAQFQRLDGRLDDARSTALKALAHGLDGTDLHRTLLDVAFLQHDTAAFDRQFAWFKANASEEDLDSLQADLDESQGKIHSAVALRLHVSDLQQKEGLTEAAQESFSEIPQLEAELGLLPDARLHLLRYVPQTPLVGQSLTAVITAAAELGQLDLAQKKLDFMHQNSKQDSDVLEIFAPESEAALDLARGKPDQAIAALQPTSPYELSDDTVPAIRARAFLAAHQPILAEREFRTLIDRPYTSVISPMVPLAHLGLARALAMQGNITPARQEYDTFFTLWKDADPNLPLLHQAHLELNTLNKPFTSNHLQLP